MQFSIIGDVGNKITLDIQKIHSNAKDYEANWANAKLDIVIPGFASYFAFGFEVESIRHFLNGLEKMLQTLAGSAGFYVIDGDIDLEGYMDKSGHIKWKVVITHPRGYGAKLIFEMHSDQSYLPQLISEVKAVLDEFPIIKSE